jgi:hypothetical protein
VFILVAGHRVKFVVCTFVCSLVVGAWSSVVPAVTQVVVAVRSTV